MEAIELTDFITGALNSPSSTPLRQARSQHD